MRPTSLLRWLPLLLALVMVFGDATAFAQDNGREPLTIGFSQVGSESDWRTAFTEITLAEAERRGINDFLERENTENQIAALVRSLSRVSMIARPGDETGWALFCRRSGAGIPVVIIDRNVTADDSLYLAHSSDFVFEGRLAAAWLAQATSGNSKIVELQGTVGSSAARDGKSASTR